MRNLKLWITKHCWHFKIFSKESCFFICYFPTKSDGLPADSCLLAAQRVDGGLMGKITHRIIFHTSFMFPRCILQLHLCNEDLTHFPLSRKYDKILDTKKKKRNPNHKYTVVGLQPDCVIKTGCLSVLSCPVWQCMCTQRSSLQCSVAPLPHFLNRVTRTKFCKCVLGCFKC